MAEPKIIYNPDEHVPDKITVASANHDDPGCVTFNIKNEDHTLGNVLRYMIMKNPDVSYCGYSIPHPSETKINLRIQTENGTAVDALNKGLDDIIDMCEHVLETFETTLTTGEYKKSDDVDISQ